MAGATVVVVRSSRQYHYGRSDSKNLKMKTPSSINGKLFKPTSVTCWDSSQLQELQKMKLPLLFSSTVAICLAGPQYLRNYGISSNLRRQSYSRNFAIQRVPSGFGGLSSPGLSLQGNYLGYPNGGQLKTYSNFQNYLSKTPVPFSEPARVDDIIPPAQTGNYMGKQLDQVAICLLLPPAWPT